MPVYTDQGIQFTSAAWREPLEGRSIRISQHRKGRYLDNILLERLWCSLNGTPLGGKTALIRRKISPS